MTQAMSLSLTLLFIGLYMAAWWFAVWNAIRRREAFVIPFFGVLVFGLGVPMMLAGLSATADNTAPYTVARIMWIALPFVMIAVFALIRSLRSR